METSTPPPPPPPPEFSSEDCTNVGKLKARPISKQILFGLLTNFSTIAPSMSLGYSAIALPAFGHPASQFFLSPDQCSWFASIASLATPFGCLLVGPLSDRLGRRFALKVVNFVCFLGWITIAAAKFAPHHYYAVLLCGRILTGLSTGLSSIPATVYMAEVSSVHLRGVFCTWSSVSFCVGVLVVYTLGYFYHDDWATIALISSSLPVLGLAITVFFVPETPNWLISKCRLDEARRNMCKIYAVSTFTAEVRSEIDALMRSQRQKLITQSGGSCCTGTSSTIKWTRQVRSKLKHLMHRSCTKPFILIASFFFFQQMAGTVSIVFYAINVTTLARIQVDPYLTIVLIAIVRLITSIVSSYVCKLFGRRPLALFSGIGMTATMLGLSLYIFLAERTATTTTTTTVPPSDLYPIVLLLGFFLTSTLGFLPLPFAMGAEVFPRKVRATASGLAVALAYLFSFGAVKMYPWMEAQLNAAAVFLVYGVVSLVGSVYVMIALPETKGKTFDEIQQMLGAKSSLTKSGLHAIQPTAIQSA